MKEIKECKKAVIISMFFLISASLLLLSNTIVPISQEDEMVPYPIEQRDSLIASDKVAAEAGKIEGVVSAVALPLNKSIYLGLNLGSNNDHSIKAETEKAALNRAKIIAPNYDIKVTSDVKAVSKIKDLIKENSDIRIPLSNYEPELKKIDLIIQRGS